MRHAKNGLAAKFTIFIFTRPFGVCVERHWHRRNPRRARYQALVAPQPCIRSILSGSYHDAVMRIGGELRGGGSILHRGVKAIVKKRITTTRIVIGRPLTRPAKPVVLLSDPFLPSKYRL